MNGQSEGQNIKSEMLWTIFAIQTTDDDVLHQSSKKLYQLRYMQNKKIMYMVKFNLNTKKKQSH